MLSTLATDLQTAAEHHLPAALTWLRRMVDCNSFTANAPGVDAVGRLTAECFADLGFEPEFVPSQHPDHGHHLFLRRPGLVSAGQKPVVLVTHLDWRWIFTINIPIGIVAFVIAGKLLREHREPTAGNFDAWGFVLSAIGFAAFVFGVSEGPRSGWLSPVVLMSGLGGLAVIALMVSPPKVGPTWLPPLMAAR